jgi:hypothetical protein
VGTVIGAVIKQQFKSSRVTDEAKYYYLLMLKKFVDTGNKELVVDFIPKSLMKRLGLIALHRREEQAMDRGTDCIRQYSALNDPAIDRANATGYCKKTS